MKKTIIGGIILIFAALIAFNYVMPSCLRQQQNKISNLKKVSKLLKKENRPLAFKIDERNDTSVHVKIKFYDLEKREVASISKTLEGTELFLDFENYKAGNQYLSFPAKLFTNYIPAEKGLSLYPFYDKKGFPMIFSSDSLTVNEKNAFTAIFTSVKDTLKTENSFGDAVHDIENLKHFEVGTEYVVIAHSKGGIEIIEN